MSPDDIDVSTTERICLFDPEENFNYYELSILTIENQTTSKRTIELIPPQKQMDYRKIKRRQRKMKLKQKN